MKLFSVVLILIFIYVPCAFSENLQDEMSSFMNEKESSEDQFNQEMKGKNRKPAPAKRSSDKLYKHQPVGVKNIPKVDVKVPDPVAEYLFTGNADDSSGNSNHGIVTGAQLTTDRGGNENSAYIFYERPHRIEIPRTSLNTISTGSFTVSFWIKTKDDGSVLKGILTNSTGSSTQYWGFNYTSNGKVHFILKNSESESAFITHPINDYKWHQVTGVRNSETNTMSLYVDGQLIQSRQGVSGNLDSGGKINVGDHMNRLFTGRIDDIRMWNDSLSGNHLKSIHARETGTPVFQTKPLELASAGIPDPVATYMFDGNADDSSGNNNHGIVNGAELIQDRGGNKDKAYLFYERPHRIKIPRTPANTFSSGSFTASFWFKSNDNPTVSKGLLTNNAGSNPTWGFNYTTGGKLHFILRNQEKDSSSIIHTINDGKWHHVTGTRNTTNNTMSLYVDSQLVQTKPAVTGSVDSLSDIWIGDHKNLLFIGRIDDVMLWDKPFTLSQLERFHTESAASVVQSASSPDEDSLEDPVGIYRFNGNANDESANNNHGIVTAAHLSEDRFGKQASAYCFSERNNRIKIPLIPENTFSTGSFTVRFWVKINDSRDGGFGIVTNTKNSNPQWMFHYSENGKLSFMIRDKEKQSSMISSLSPVNDGKWHKITGIRNAGNNTITLYIDGKHVKTRAGVNGDVNSGNDIWIGEHSNRLFKGCIDDVVIWRRAFSPKEIREMNTVNVSRPDPTGGVKIKGKLNPQKYLPKN